MAILRHQRARVLMALAVKSNEPVPAIAREDVLYSLSLNDRSPLLLLDAAAILLRGESVSDEDKDQALMLLERAVALGFSGDRVLKDASYESLKEYAGFAALAGQDGGKPAFNRDLELTIPPPRVRGLAD
jgi:hypothetical protein